MRKRRKNCGDIKSLLQKYSLNSKPIEEIVASAVTRSESDGLMSDRYEIDIENKGLLWVDKYTPRSYIELLSDEVIKKAIHRLLLCFFFLLVHSKINFRNFEIFFLLVHSKKSNIEVNFWYKFFF